MILSGGRGVNTAQNIQTTIQNAVARSNQARTLGTRTVVEVLRDNPAPVRMRATCPPGSTCETQAKKEREERSVLEDVFAWVKTLTNDQRHQEWYRFVKSHRRTCANRLFEPTPADGFEHRIERLEAASQTLLAHLGLLTFFIYHDGANICTDGFRNISENSCNAIDHSIWAFLGGDVLIKLLSAERAEEAIRILANAIAKHDNPEALRKMLRKNICK